MTESEPTPHEELAAIAAALGAHLERLRDSGAHGLPRGSARPASSVAAGEAPGIGGADPGPTAHAPPREASPQQRERAAPSPGAAPGRAANAPASRVTSERPAPTAAQAAPSGNTGERLRVLQAEISTCTRCRLHEGRTQTVFARGNGSSGVCFVGEGPGADEDAQGYPFVGKAGQLLDKMIAAMGLARDDVYVCNIVKCRPPNNRKPEPDEMAACRPFLVEQIQLVSPKVIVALGATAVAGLGIGGGIMRLRGQWRLYNGIPVMPTFHPAYLLRTPQAKRDVWNDLQEVLKHLGLPIPQR